MYITELLLVVFSARGGIYTGRIMPVLTAYFPVVMARRSSTQAGTGGTGLQLLGSSVADCQTLT